MQSETKEINLELQDPLSACHRINMGPAHPAMHGIIRLILDLQGERIKKCDVELGYLHRGFEKECEARSYGALFPYTDRLNYVSPLINNTGYALAVEKLLGITVSERVSYIRVVMNEISRITDHLTCIGAGAMEVGAMTAFLYLMEAREALYDVIDEVTGARITVSYIRIGGVAQDLPDGFESRVREAFKKVRGKIKEVEKLLYRNRIFVDRMAGVGILSKERAIGYGITGPFLRSTGVDYDVRKASPYLIYDRLDFDIPLGRQGDNLDRYYVRTEEMMQSMRIIEQALSKMPSASSDSRVKTAALPDKKDTYGNIEGLMNHFKLIMDGQGIQPPKGEVYFPVEGANGELGFYIVSDGSDRPYRLHCKAPCLATMSALAEILQGLTVADIVATFGTINMIAGELER